MSIQLLSPVIMHCNVTFGMKFPKFCRFLYVHREVNSIDGFTSYRKVFPRQSFCSTFWRKTRKSEKHISRWGTWKANLYSENRAFPDSDASICSLRSFPLAFALFPNVSFLIPESLSSRCVRRGFWWHLRFAIAAFDFECVLSALVTHDEIKWALNKQAKAHEQFWFLWKRNITEKA